MIFQLFYCKKFNNREPGNLIVLALLIKTDLATASVNITVGGQHISPRKLDLRHSFYGHHSFAIHVASDKLEGKDGYSIDNSLENIGKDISIEIQRVNQADSSILVFKGIITSV
ncbi:MAG: hypothetical protein KDD63_16240, partial [Bacteroidetes bacterium]|nr:hypothetical protein [Bacteroidota bacterium]